MNASLGECEQIPILNPILNNPLLNPINGNTNPDALPVSQAVSQASRAGDDPAAPAGRHGGPQLLRRLGRQRLVVHRRLPGRQRRGQRGRAADLGPREHALHDGRRRHGALQRRQRARRPQLERAWEYSGGNSSPFIRAPDYQQGVGQPQPPVRGRQQRPADQHRPAVPRRAGRRGALGRRGGQRLHDRLRRRGRRRQRHEPLLPAVGGHVGRRPQHRAAGRHLRVRQPVDLRDRQGPGALRRRLPPTSPPAPTASTPPWPATTTSPASAPRAWPG